MKAKQNDLRTITDVVLSGREGIYAEYHNHG